MEIVVSKKEIKDYINNKTYLGCEPAGVFWKVRIGERSCLEGLYTKPVLAQRALEAHVGDVIFRNKKREAKKNAKKDKS